MFRAHRSEFLSQDWQQHRQRSLRNKSIDHNIYKEQKWLRHVLSYETFVDIKEISPHPEQGCGVFFYGKRIKKNDRTVMMQSFMDIRHIRPGQ